VGWFTSADASPWVRGMADGQITYTKKKRMNGVEQHMRDRSLYVVVLNACFFVAGILQWGDRTKANS
jgi:hypothetical protein